MVVIFFGVEKWCMFVWCNVLSFEVMSLFVLLFFIFLFFVVLGVFGWLFFVGEDREDWRLDSWVGGFCLIELFNCCL